MFFGKEAKECLFTTFAELRAWESILTTLLQLLPLSSPRLHSGSIVDRHGQQQQLGQNKGNTFRSSGPSLSHRNAHRRRVRRLLVIAPFVFCLGACVFIPPALQEF